MVLSDPSNKPPEDFVYDNLLDEVLFMVADPTNTATTYYLDHDHLVSRASCPPLQPPALLGDSKTTLNKKQIPPAALLDDSGTVLERYEYDAYGQRRVYDPDFTDERTTSDYTLTVAFTGQRLDLLDTADLPLMYYKNRTYSPSLALFLQRDILRYVDSSNLYLYCLSSPVDRTDSYGFRSVSDPLGVKSLDCGKVLKNLMAKVEAAPDAKTRCKQIRFLYATIAYGGDYKGMKEAPSLLIHWLRGSGTRTHVSQDLLTSDWNVLDFMKEVRLKVLREVSETGCTKESEVTQVWQKQIKAERIDLYYAMGDFIMKGRAYYDYAREKGCGFCKMFVRFQWDVIDTYDWDKDFTNVCGVQVPDAYPRELEQCDEQHPKPFKTGFPFWEDFGCAKCYRPK